MLQKFVHQNKAWKLVIIIAHIIAINCLINLEGKAQIESTVQLKWLGMQTPTIPTGVSWGVPFKKGEVLPDSDYILKDSSGNPLLLQSWPLAYWPDGSIKWVGLSTVVEAESGSTFQLQPTEKADKAMAKIRVTESDESVHINTGILQCDIPRQGSKIISSLKIDNREISSGGELVCICLLYTSPSPRDAHESRMPSSA